MADKDKQAPGAMAGITSYDVNPEKFKLKPMHVVAIIIGAIATEAFLFILL